MKPEAGRTQRGFTLLELSIVLTIIALVVGMSVSMGVSVIATANLTATRQKMKTIENALMQYRTANDRVPCPADLTITQGSANFGVEAGAGAGSAIGTGTGVCTGTGMLPQANFTGAGATNTWQTAAEGALPAVTLGLSPDFMYDGWGNHFRYAVDISYTANGAFAGSGLGCVNGAITVNDANGNARSTGSVYALISHGANGHGAYTRNGVSQNAGSVNTNELANCHCNSSGTATAYAPTYVQMQQTQDPANSLDNFDDLATYKERWQMQTNWDKVGSCAYVYVADEGNNRVDVLTTSGAYVNQFGSAGGGQGQFTGVPSVALDSSGNIFVADAFNNRVQKFSSSGTYLGQIGCSGTNGCANSSANGSFHIVYGITIDSSNNLWAVDIDNNRVEKFNSGGTFLMGIGAGYNGVSGSVGSSGTGNGQFNFSASAFAEGISIDKSGNVWVTDAGNVRVQEFSSSGSWIGTLGTTSSCTNCLCTSGSCPTSAGWGNGQFGFPNNVNIDNSGNIWVADEGNDYVHKFSSSGTFLFRIGVGGAGSTGGEFWGPYGLAFDASGNLWASDTSNNRVQEFNSSGTYLGQIGCAGTSGCNPGGAGGSGHGQVYNPLGLFISSR